MTYSNCSSSIIHFFPFCHSVKRSCESKINQCPPGVCVGQMEGDAELKWLALPLGFMLEESLISLIFHSQKRAFTNK